MDPNADTYRMNEGKVGKESIGKEEEKRKRWERREGSDERIGMRIEGEIDQENRIGKKRII